MVIVMEEYMPFRPANRAALATGTEREIVAPTAKGQGMASGAAELVAAGYDPGTSLTLSASKKKRRCRMPWLEKTPAKLRVEFVIAHDSGEHSFTELCDLFGVSRQCGYKWSKRWETSGVPGLDDRSRAQRRVRIEWTKRSGSCCCSPQRKFDRWRGVQLRQTS
jgi:hypothetical protein